MPNTETLPVCPLATELQAFDVSLYQQLFNQVVQRGLLREEARQVVALAATNDGVGLVTEKVSGEKDKYGYIFDVESRVRMQLTPPRHYYLQEEDKETGQLMMVAPEHKWRDFKKDALELIDDWRRGLDKVGMIGVRAAFLDQTDQSLAEGETLVWGSPKAEEWEGPLVMKYNGAYGFLYVGRVTNIDGVKALEVLDFKNDLDAQAYELLYEKMGEVHTDPAYLKHPLVDKVKASYVRSKREWTGEEVWQKLAEVQKEVVGSAEIFNLPVTDIIALQDPQLHQRIRQNIATPIGEWIAEEIYQGIDIKVIQEQIRQKFIGETTRLIMEINVEGSGGRYLKGYTAADYLNKTLPFNTPTNQPDSAVLARYSGSSGDGCGSWGSSKVHRSGRSSVSGLSSSFSGEKGSQTCAECGLSISDDHYHCDNCGKKYESERNSTKRTPQCVCGQEFGCSNSAEKEKEDVIINFPTKDPNPAELNKAA